MVLFASYIAVEDSGINRISVLSRSRLITWDDLNHCMLDSPQNGQVIPVIS